LTMSVIVKFSLPLGISWWIWVC